MANSIFSFENHSLRVELINGEPSFLARDLCTTLGYKNVKQTLEDHVDPKDVSKRYTLTAGGRQLMSWVNESGMYALIFGSKLPSALRFKRWVTSEVLPAQAGLVFGLSIPPQATGFCRAFRPVSRRLERRPQV